MKLYTRSGDDGTTGLFGGDRVPKDHPRVEAYGCVDELNACIGLAVVAIAGNASGAPGLTSRQMMPDPAKATSARKTRIAPDATSFPNESRRILTTLQSCLFDIGADLATPHGSAHKAKVQRIADGQIIEIENWIDEVDAGNTPMTHFILPGGTELSARLHLARTICRRAERAVVRLSHAEQINPQALIYLNRASDLLFAMARRANKEAGVKDVEWIARAP